MQRCPIFLIDLPVRLIFPVAMFKRQILVLLFGCYCFLAHPVYGRVNDSVTILQQSLSGKLSDTVRLKSLTRLADLLISDKKTFRLGEVYVNKALELAHEKKLQPPCRLHWLNAILLRSHEMPKKAVEEMDIVIMLLETENNFPEAARAKNYKASLLLFAGQFNESLDLYRENVAVARAQKLKSVIPEAYQGMATVYGQIKNTVEQKKYLELALDAARQEDIPAATAMAYLRMGTFLMFLDSNHREAIPYLQRSLEIRKASGDSLEVMTVLNMIGWFFYLGHEPDSSLGYYLRSVSFCPPGHIAGFAKPYGNIGTIYRDKKEYKKALYYYGLCEQYAEKTRDFYILAGLYKDMSDMFRTRGDYNQAYEYYVAYKNYHDSLNAGRYQEGLAFARTKFDTEAKEKELELLNMKFNQQKYVTYGFSGFILLLLVIGVLIYYQSRTAAQRKISEMNNRLSEITHANLRQQMNPHFIFNTLNSIQYYMYQHDKIATNNYLTKFSRLIRKILENSQHTLVPIKDELDVIQLYLELETLRFKEKFTFEIIVDEEMDALTCKIPTMLIQPYVENAVCHGLLNKPDHGLLTVTIRLCDHHICCMIEDNGIGREAAMDIKMQKDTPNSSLGTKITESRINLTNALYGTDLKVIFTDLKDGQGNPTGTRVELQLPLMT